MPSAWPELVGRGERQALGRAGAYGSDPRIDEDPDREPELGVVVADVQVGGAGALRREGAVQADARELDARARRRRGRSRRPCWSRSPLAVELAVQEARRQAAMAAGHVRREAGRVLDPDPHRQPVLGPVKLRLSSPAATGGRHDEAPLVEVVADRRGDVAARRRRRRRARRSAQRSRGAHRSAPGEADRERDAAHALGLGEAARLELVGGEAVEVVAQRRS